jgi:hypothetical protein
MRLGATRKITLEAAPEASFEVRTSFGARRRYLEAIAAAIALEGATGQLGAIDATIDFLADVIVSWEGVEAADGTPLPFQREALYEFPEWLLTELISQIINGDADRGNVVSGSASLPATSSEETP